MIQNRDIYAGSRVAIISLIILMLTLVATAGAETITVDDDNSGADHEYIQAAIDAASPGDIVEVSPGTYVETITINKSIRLIATDGATIKAPSDLDDIRLEEADEKYQYLVGLLGGSYSASNDTVYGDGTITVEVSGFTFDANNTSPDDRWCSVLSRNVNRDDIGITASIHNNTFENIRVDSEKTFGILGYGTMDITVRDNTLDQFSRGGIGFYDGHAEIINNTVIGPYDGGDITHAPNGIQLGYGASGLIQDNNVSNCGYPGSDWAGTAIMVVDTSNVIVDQNHIHDSEVALSIVDFPEEKYGSRWAGTCADITVTDNLIEDNEYGLDISNDVDGVDVSGNDIRNNLKDGISVYDYEIFYPEYTIPDPVNIEIHNNNIAGNGDYGLYVDSNMPEVSATDNWWGSPAGANHTSNTYNKALQGENVSDKVDFTPWLDAEYPAGESFAPVEITNPGGGFASIGAAIDDADEGDTILAKAGTFTEEVAVNKAVTVTGQTGTPCYKPTTLEGRFNILVDGVTLKEFRITNTGNSGEIEGIFVGNSNGFIDDPAAMIEISSNVIETIRSTSNKTVEGIHVKSYDNFPINGVIIKDNVIQDVKTELNAGANGIKLQANVSNITVISNKIEDIRGKWTYGITLTPSNSEPGIPKDVDIRHNMFRNITAYESEGMAIGIDGAKADEAIVNWNCFMDTLIGALNKDEQHVLDARYNYWNSSSGPYNASTSPNGAAAYPEDMVNYANYTTECADIDIEASVNEMDADEPTGPMVQIGSGITWKYNVTNTGVVKLVNISVTDAELGNVNCPQTTLMPGESVVWTADTGVSEGQFESNVTATGKTICSIEVSDSDPVHYVGIYYHPQPNFDVPTANPVALIGILGIGMVLFLRRERKD
ncbi:right-handed parallel beta-helix repeat-containing protein [Methanohalophilus sp.]